MKGFEYSGPYWGDGFEVEHLLDAGPVINMNRQLWIFGVTYLITKCDSYFYYKVRQLFCYKVRQGYYKVRQVLQSVTGIKKCDNFITKCDRC